MGTRIYDSEQRLVDHTVGYHNSKEYRDAAVVTQMACMSDGIANTGRVNVDAIL